MSYTDTFTNGHQSIEDFAEHGEGEMEELFPLGSIEGDAKVSHKNMIKPGMSVKIEAKLSNAAVPMTNGLFPFGHRGEVLVTFEAGKYTPTPEFGDEGADGNRKATGVKIAQSLRAVYVRDASDMLTREQVIDMFSAVGVDDATIAKALGTGE